jgi:hypothetical protein
MDCTVRKNRWKSFMLIDCLADSGAAETYTADEFKMAVSPSQQKAISVMLYFSILASSCTQPAYKPPKAMSVSSYWDTTSLLRVQKLYRREREEQALGRQSIKRWL